MDGFAADSGSTVEAGTTDAGREGARQIEALSEADQRALIVELADYAGALIRWYRARFRGRDALPGGYDAGSLALEAIARVLDGRRRPWDPTKEPSLLAYLKSVVKSIFSTEILRNAKRDSELRVVDEDGNDVADGPASTPRPGDEEEEVKVERLTNELLALFEVEEDQLVLLCMMDEKTKAADIAEELDLPEKDVYRIKQKIKRRLDTWKRED